MGRASISRLTDWSCRIVKYLSLTLSSPYLPLHHLCCLTASPWLIPQLLFLFSGYKLSDFYLFHGNCWIMKVPIATQSAIDSRRKNAAAEPAVAILKVKRGSCYRHIRWSSFPRFMICFAPCLNLFRGKKKKKKLDMIAAQNKDPRSASVTMLNKNPCVLFYSLVSLFWVNFGGSHTRQTYFWDSGLQQSLVRPQAWELEQFCSITLELIVTSHILNVRHDPWMLQAEQQSAVNVRVEEEERLGDWMRWIGLVQAVFHCNLTNKLVK